jgi:hypothetical protein
MGHPVVVEYVWFVGTVALCAGLGWVALKIEPHWVSRDGRRMLCMGQEMDRTGSPRGRWRETRVAIPADGPLRIEQKRVMRRQVSYWTLVQQAPDAPRRKAVFLLRGHDRNGVDALFALRLPANSKALPLLRERLPG